MKRFIFITIFSFYTFIFSSNILFAADRTEPPTVTTITGPTSGVVGNTYTFSATTSSIESIPMETVFLNQTTNPDTTFGRISLGYIDAGETECSTTSCTISKTFTPNESGTYYLYVSINFQGTSCNTHPSLSETNCYESRGKYITFVVTEEDTAGTELPNTGIENIYVSIIGLLFIITGFILNTYIHPTSRETIFINFEDKFKNR